MSRLYPRRGRPSGRLPLRPGEDGARVGEDRAVGELERRQLRIPGGRAQLLARSLAQEGDRAPVGGDHLVVVDAGGSEALLHATAGVEARAAVVAVADVQRGPVWHTGPAYARRATAASPRRLTSRRTSRSPGASPRRRPAG